MYDSNILDQPVWRIELYTIKKKRQSANYIADVSNFYTTSLVVKKERNYPDEISFTLDLQQLQNKASELGLDSRSVIEPYKHNVRVYRNNTYIAQGIVQKVSVNLNNQAKNTVEVQCVDILGILERRLIHQDYAQGSWCDFAAQIISDAQHEPNRIYNYAFEGDGIGIDNAWFRGWTFILPDSLKDTFPDWEPGVKYNQYAKCNYDGRFWECNTLHISGDTFQQSNWTELGYSDGTEGNLSSIYGVWREDDNEPGPSGSNFGGWGGTSSCHMTARTYTYNVGSSGSIDLAGSGIGTSLVAPIRPYVSKLPAEYIPVEYIESDGHAWIDTGTKLPETEDGILISSAIEFLEPLNQQDHYLMGAFQVAGPSGFQMVMTPVEDGYTATVQMGKFSQSNDYHFSKNAPHYMTSYFPGGTSTSWVVIDDTTLATINHEQAGALDTSIPFYIGSSNNNSVSPGARVNLPMRIYEAEIMKGDFETLQYFQPCVSKADGTAGLYDVEAGKFYPSAGSSSFVAGPEIKPITDISPLVHMHAWVRPLDLETQTTLKFFIQGHGGAQMEFSPTFTFSTGLGQWQKIEYDFDPNVYSIYRCGIVIDSGEALVDSPAIYQTPEPGDIWDLGIRVGSFPSVQEQLAAGWDRNRHTPIFAWKNAKEALQDLSNMDADNFWFESDINYNFNFSITAGSPSVTLELSYPRNITSMTITTNATDLVNYIKGDGSEEVKQDPMVSGIKNTNAAPFTWIDYNIDSMNEYWPLADAEAYNSERTISALTGDIKAQLNTYSNLLDVPQITIDNGTVSPEDFNIGDIISVASENTPYAQRANGLYKVYSYQIDVDKDNRESLSITLLIPTALQLNALSFPQLIKNLQKRVKNS